MANYKELKFLYFFYPTNKSGIIKFILGEILSLYTSKKQ